MYSWKILMSLIYNFHNRHCLLFTSHSQSVTHVTRPRHVTRSRHVKRSTCDRLTTFPSQLSLHSSVQKFYCRVYSVLYDFKYIPCDVIATKLLDSYCLDVYGSQL